MVTAHKSPTLLFDGVLYRMERYRDGCLRLRSRSAHHPVSYATGTPVVTLAKQLARKWLEERKAGKPVVTSKTAADLIAVYERLPKRAAARSSGSNVGMFKLVLRTVLGRAPDKVMLHEITPKLWMDYFAAKQGRATADLASRSAKHVSYNTAVRCARCLLLETLRDGYLREGIKMPAAGKIAWLQTVAKVPAKYDDGALLKEWKLVRDRALWWTVALARFAGLRRDEIKGCRAGWLVNVEGVWCVEVRDREEEAFFCKSGRPRMSPILNADVVREMRRLKGDGFVVMVKGSRAKWFRRVPQAWLRGFMPRGEIKKPLHRLRAAYLDNIRRSELMRLQGESVEASARAAGHRSSRTTMKHYLPQQLSA